MSHESIKTRFTRYIFNFAPVLRGTGMWISHISHDWRVIKVKLPLNIFTRNYVGTIFGGSIYSAVDPFYMLMLIKNLGPKYVVWDKEAHIKFIKPGKETIRAEFIIDDDLLASIKNEVAVNHKYIFDLQVAFLNSKKDVIALITKTLYVADKHYYKNRKAPS